MPDLFSDAAFGLPAPAPAEARAPVVDAQEAAGQEWDTDPVYQAMRTRAEHVARAGRVAVASAQAQQQPEQHDLFSPEAFGVTPESRLMPPVETYQPEGGVEHLRRMADISSLGAVLGNRDVSQAQQRLSQGQDNWMDRHILQQQRESLARDQTLGTGGQILRTAEELVPMAVQSQAAAPFVGAAVARIPGIGSLAARAASPAATLAERIGAHAATQAVATPIVPAMWAPQWTAHNVEQGRDAFDPRGLPRALGEAYIQNLILNSTGRIVEGIGGETLWGLAARQGLRMPIGIAEFATADVLGGMAGMNTHYGLVGDMLNNRWGDALDRLVQQSAAVFAFGLMHEMRERPVVPEREQGPLGLPGPEARPAGLPGPEPTPGAGPTPEPGPRPGGAGPRPEPPPRPRSGVRTAQEALREGLDAMGKAGFTRGEAAAILRAVLHDLQNSPTGGDTRSFDARFSERVDALIHEHRGGPAPKEAAPPPPPTPPPPERPQAPPASAPVQQPAEPPPPVRVPEPSPVRPVPETQQPGFMRPRPPEPGAPVQEPQRPGFMRPAPPAPGAPAQEMPRPGFMRPAPPAPGAPVQGTQQPGFMRTPIGLRPATAEGATRSLETERQAVRAEIQTRQREIDRAQAEWRRQTRGFGDIPETIIRAQEQLTRSQDRLKDIEGRLEAAYAAVDTEAAGGPQGPAAPLGFKMTDRERQVMEWREQDPPVPFREIGRRLGVTGQTAKNDEKAVLARRAEQRSIAAQAAVKVNENIAAIKDKQQGALEGVTFRNVDAKDVTNNPGEERDFGKTFEGKMTAALDAFVAGLPKQGERPWTQAEKDIINHFEQAVEGVLKHGATVTDEFRSRIASAPKSVRSAFAKSAKRFEVTTENPVDQGADAKRVGGIGAPVRPAKPDQGAGPPAAPPEGAGGGRPPGIGDQGPAAGRSEAAGNVVASPFKVAAETGVLRQRDAVVVADESKPVKDRLRALAAADTQNLDAIYQQLGLKTNEWLRHAEEALRQYGERAPVDKGYRKKLDEALEQTSRRIREELIPALERNGHDKLASFYRAGADIVDSLRSEAPAQAAGNFVTGSDTTILVPGSKPIYARYEVREMGDVKASNEVLPGGGFRNRASAGEYPAGLQPRDYSRNAAEAQKVLRNAAELEPRILISRDPQATTGPPIISNDGFVINGNGRQMSLERSRQAGTYEKYKADLLAQVKSFGIDPAKVAAMKEPVLYRVADMTGASPEAAEFARRGNIVTTQSQSVVETAASMARLIPSDIAEQIHLEAGTTFSEAITRPSGKAFRERLLHEIRQEAPSMEADLFERNGSLTDKGVEFVRQMLLTRILPANTIRDLGEQRRALLNGIEGAIPQLLLFQRGAHGTNITPQIREALEIFARNPEMKKAADVDLVVSQGDLFGGMKEPITPAGRMMLDFLVENRDAPAKLRRGLVELAGGSDMKRGGLFGEQMGSMAEIAAEALGVEVRPGAQFGHQDPEVRNEAAQAIKSGSTPAAAEQAILGGEESADEDFASKGTAPKIGARSTDAGSVPGATNVPGGGAVSLRHAQPVPAAGPAAPGLEQRQPSSRRIVRRGAIDLSVFRDAWPGIKDWWNGFYDALEKFGGVSVPKATRLSERVGQSLMEWGASATYAREAGSIWSRKILGDGFNEVRDATAGAALLEMRFRYAKENLRKLANQALADAQAARQAGDHAKARELTAKAAAYDNKAQKITTVFGMAGSPITSDAQYQKIVNSPVFGEIMTRYVEFGRALDELYVKANGKQPDSVTQIPGLPFNLKALDHGDLTADGKVFKSKRGNLRNIKQKRDPFAEEAGLDAEAYEMRLSAMIENSLNRRVSIANRAEANRVIVAEGLGAWGTGKDVPEFRGLKGREVPFVRPPIGTQQNAPGENSLFLHPDLYPEYLEILDIKDPWKIPIWSEFVTPALTRLSLASTTEFMYHGVNNFSAMMQPGMSFRDLFNNYVGVMRDTPAIRDSLMELARIGATKMAAEGLESGQLWGGSTLFGMLDKPIPPKSDPTHWMGKFLEVYTRAVRLTADQAYTSLVKQGLAPDSQTGRANFINKLTGNYNNLTMSRMVHFLRETGIGPFATAAANFNMRALDRVLLMRTGVQNAKPLADAQLRGRMLLKYLGLLAAAAISNFIATGRWDGHDDLPIGGIYMGMDEEGRLIYWDPARMVGMRRTLNVSGGGALIESVRRKRETGETIDRMQRDILHSMFHPAMGPAVNFAHTVATGDNAIGMHLAERAAPGESQAYQNLMAALKTANPPVATLLGAERPREPQRASDAWRLLGPIGPQYRNQQR